MDRSLTAEELIKKYKGKVSFKFKNQNELETLILAIKSSNCTNKDAINTVVCGLEVYSKWLANVEGQFVTENNVSYNDLVMLCKETLLICFRTFDINKGDNIYKTFLSYYRIACRNSIKKLNKDLIKHRTESLDTPLKDKSEKGRDKRNLHEVLTEPEQGIDLTDKFFLKELKENIIPKLPLTYQRIVKMHFFDGKSILKISKVEGCSRGNISRKLKTAIKLINSTIENESLLIFENN